MCSDIFSEIRTDTSTDTQADIRKNKRIEYVNPHDTTKYDDGGLGLKGH